eukprot:m.132157 g.132157  ORF g.132157 m.132157 type:complete len:795 (-) comp13786_c0_seq1:182-2566(-)
MRSLVLWVVAAACLAVLCPATAQQAPSGGNCFRNSSCASRDCRASRCCTPNLPAVCVGCNITGGCLLGNGSSCTANAQCATNLCATRCCALQGCTECGDDGTCVVAEVASVGINDAIATVSSGNTSNTRFWMYIGVVVGVIILICCCCCMACGCCRAKSGESKEFRELNAFVANPTFADGRAASLASAAGAPLQQPPRQQPRKTPRSSTATASAKPPMTKKVAAGGGRAGRGAVAGPRPGQSQKPRPRSSVGGVGAPSNKPSAANRRSSAPVAGAAAAATAASKAKSPRSPTANKRASAPAVGPAATAAKKAAAVKGSAEKRKSDPSGTAGATAAKGGAKASTKAAATPPSKKRESRAGKATGKAAGQPTSDRNYVDVEGTAYAVPSETQKPAGVYEQVAVTEAGEISPATTLADLKADGPDEEENFDGFGGFTETDGPTSDPTSDPMYAGLDPEHQQYGVGLGPPSGATASETDPDPAAEVEHTYDAPERRPGDVDTLDGDATYSLTLPVEFGGPAAGAGGAPVYSGLSPDHAQYGVSLESEGPAMYAGFDEDPATSANGGDAPTPPLAARTPVAAPPAAERKLQSSSPDYVGGAGGDEVYATADEPNPDHYGKLGPGAHGGAPAAALFDGIAPPTEAEAEGDNFEVEPPEAPHDENYEVVEPLTTAPTSAAAATSSPTPAVVAPAGDSYATADAVEQPDYEVVDESVPPAATGEAPAGGAAVTEAEEVEYEVLDPETPAASGATYEVVQPLGDAVVAEPDFQEEQYDTVDPDAAAAPTYAALGGEHQMYASQ